MSATPPVRRRVHPAVTIRRAQSERRYLSPWQVSWPPPPIHPPLLHHDAVRGSTWTWVDHHHHAPRTAFIPPVSVHQPRMISHCQTVFADGGSVRYRPSLSCARLPPIALGSPPMLPPLTLEERLAQDRLTAFLAGETLPHQPRSILSCPESPLYESLLSCFNEPEDTITLPETEAEHEYQQIELVNGASRGEDHGGGKATTHESEPRDRGSSDYHPPNAGPETHRHLHKIPLTKLSTLDVRPERHNKENEVPQDVKHSCSSRKDIVDGSVAKTRKHSMQSTSSQESQKSANYTLSSSPGDNTSVVSDSDTYQELSQPSTVIYISSGKINPEVPESSRSSESSGFKSSTKHSGNLSRGNSQHHVSSQGSHTSSSGSSKNSYKTCHPSRPGSADAMSQDQVMERGKPPAVTFPPLTIELPETKPTGWRYEHHISAKKATQARHNDSPYIITTLDPLIKRSHHKHHNATASPEPRPSDIPPLVVNFDSEDSFSENDTIYEFEDSYWSTADENTSLYMADSDTSSVYSSIGEIYSMFVTEPEALVYVYRPPPRPRHHGPHRSSTLSYRFPTYTMTRGIGSSGGSTESESSWGGTVSFVEPSYRHSNLSVGSRGHLKIDYSCSWNRLDDFVRTTSPRDGCSDDYRLHYEHRCPQDAGTDCMTAPAALLTPWERFTDTAAG